MKVRMPHVSGQFYPSDRNSLASFLQEHLKPVSPVPAIAVMVPHAGYIYSGQIAARTFASVVLTKTVLLLGPNHTGFGRPFSVAPQGAWRTPLGEVAIDESLAEALKSVCEDLEENEDAHRFEHALEVEIPFLQYLNPGVRIVPITIATRQFERLERFARQAALALEGQEVLVVASSDMTHYEPAASAEKKDRYAIEAILDLNEKELRRVVEKYDISMCGFLPMYAAILLAKARGAHKAELVEYTHSGKVTGDMSQVVGYAGMVIR